MTVDLNGHTIDRDLTEKAELGAVFNVYGSLTVKDGSSGETGKITGGYSDGRNPDMIAGGIQINGGSLILESGSITGCFSSMRGVGVNVDGGSFLMEGGSISGNLAASHCGGVDVTGGTFTMTGGTISGNRGNNGGGVYAAESEMILSGGEISGNTALNAKGSDGEGGGIDASGDVNITITGCTITRNTAFEGSGVYLWFVARGDYSFKAGKNAVITGNKDTAGNDSNLYLCTMAREPIVTILDGKDAPDGMNIGVSASKTPTASAPVPVTDDTMQKAYLSCFSSDNNKYWTAMQDGILYLTAEPPTCSVTYTGSDRVTFSGASGNPATSAKAGDTMRFKVAADPGYTLGAVSVKKSNGESVTLSLTGDVYSFTMPGDDVTVTAGLTIDVPAAVTGLVYDGTVKAGVAEGTVYTLTDHAATDAGVYTATATLNEGYIWRGGSAEDKQISWRIDKAAPAASLFRFTAPEDLTADGKPKVASVEIDPDADITGMGVVTIQYQKLGESGWSESTSAPPVEPGMYRVLIDVGEGANFSSASGIAADGWQFTVKPGSPVITKAPKAVTGLVYNASAQTLVTPGTAKYGTLQYALTDAGTTEAPAEGWSTEVPTAVNSGDNKVWYYVKASNPDQPDTQKFFVPVSVDKATPWVKESPNASAVAYGDMVSQSVLTGGTATGLNDVVLAGTFDWASEEKNKVPGPPDLYYYVVVFTPQDTVNYAAAGCTVRLEVVPRKVTVSGITAVDRAYEKGNVTIKLDTSGATFAGLISGDELAISATGAMQDDSIGENKPVAVTYGKLSGSDAENYELAAEGSQTTVYVNILDRTVNTVTVTAGEGGSASADKTAAVPGETVTLTATPNEGYRFKEWQSEDVTVENDAFTMPKKNVAVKAAFEEDEPVDPVTYTVTVTASEDGRASVDKQTAAAGEVITLTLSSDKGYRYKEYSLRVARTGGGEEVAYTTVEKNRVYSFVMPGYDVTASAAFEPTEAPVITPGDAYVKDGEQAVFKVKAPDENLTYQWYIDRRDDRGWKAIKGAAGPTYTTAAVEQKNDGYRYKCVATGADCSSAESNIAVLHVGTTPVPPTGDNSHTLLWTALVTASGAALFCAGRKRWLYR